MNFSTATNFPPSFTRVLTGYGKSLFKAWATPANATLAAPSIFPQASRDSRDHVEWQQFDFTHLCLSCSSWFSILKQNLEVTSLSVHAQCHEKPQSDCSSLGLKTPNHWIQLATLMAVASQNCCTWNSCLASFHHSGWSLGVWKVSCLLRVVENKTAEKKDSLSSEWTNIDLWYDRKSNSMVSSQKWPPQFVPQYICHISGPSQAGPLQSTELRPPGPQRVFAMMQQHGPVLDSDSIYLQASSSSSHASGLLCYKNTRWKQHRRELRQTRISHRCKNVYLSTCFHSKQTRFSRTNMRHNASDCACIRWRRPPKSRIRNYRFAKGTAILPNWKDPSKVLTMVVSPLRILNLRCFESKFQAFRWTTQSIVNGEISFEYHIMNGAKWKFCKKQPSFKFVSKNFSQNFSQKRRPSGSWTRSGQAASQRHPPGTCREYFPKKVVHTCEIPGV